ncbi:MAG: cytidine deaminase [Bacteroidota bacterium]
MDEIKITSKYTLYKDSSELSKQDNELLKEAEEARKNSYAPYSNFCVGASLLLDNGKIIKGNNQENAAYPSGMCAERVAVWNAASQYPEAKILKIFISAKSSTHTIETPVSPCGSCRQTIAEYEFKQAKDIKIFFTGETGKIIKANSLKDLLPLAFDNSLL